MASPSQKVGVAAGERTGLCTEKVRKVPGFPEDVCAHPKLKSFRPKAGAVEAGRRADMRIRAPANTTFLCVVFCSS